MPTKLSPEKAAEKVMVVSRDLLFKEGAWHGLKADGTEKLIKLINTKHKFMARGDVEDDPAWQQIIPYMFFQYESPAKSRTLPRGSSSSSPGLEQGTKYFLMQRNAGHTDKRLADNFSIGIGGHINRKDIKGSKSQRVNVVLDWAKREFEEEVDYKGKLKAEFVGLLNDDSNDVGRVHLGLVIKISGDGDSIAVRDEHQSGQMVDLPVLGSKYKSMETWSQIIYDYLKEMSQRVNGSRQMGSQAKSQSYSSSERSESRSSRHNSASTTLSVNRTGRQARTIDIENVTGILPDWVIAQYINEGLIKIDPLSADWEEKIDQVSVDFHLGCNLKLFRGGTYRFVDTKKGLPDDAMEEVNLNDGDPFILEPGAFAIASTKEVLKLPPDILGRLEGKSSLARLGILVHSTAARFDPGWNGAPVLELGNLGPKPAILYCGMSICAFTFEKLSAPVKMAYEGSRSDRYSGSRAAVVSKIHEASFRPSNGKSKK